MGLAEEFSLGDSVGRYILLDNTMELYRLVFYIDDCEAIRFNADNSNNPA